MAIGKLQDYLNIANRIHKSSKNNTYKRIKIGLISTFTIKGLKEVIKVMSDQLGINADFYEVPYKQYVQMIINKNSPLFRFNPDIIYFLVDYLSLIPETEFFNPQEKNQHIYKVYIKNILNLLSKLENYSNSNIIFSLLPYPPQTILGNLELTYPTSTRNIIQNTNSLILKTYQKSRRISLYDINAFITLFGWNRVYNYKFHYLADYFISPEYLPHLAYQLVGYIKAITGKTKKCIVLDLDNTLWGGIVGEDGINGIKLGPEPPGKAYLEFQKTLLNFYNKGIILAINSNNNEKDVQEVFKEHPYMLLRSSYFAAFTINWKDKVTNMKSLASELNIGFDSMVYVDDDPKKRALMQQLLPDVLTVELPVDPSEYSLSLLNLNDFYQLSLTQEDLTRGKKYYQQRQRRTLKTQVTNLDDYLKSLHIKVNIDAVSDFALPRIAQLTQRTNQFNTTTRRYTEKDIKNFRTDSSCKLYMVSVADKFGDYGVCGFIKLKKLDKDNILIDSFLLSCRVLGLGIEDSILYFLTNMLQKQKIKYLLGEFIPTVKNKPAVDFYPSHGFELTEKTSKRSLWKLNLIKKRTLKPNHLLLHHD